MSSLVEKNELVVHPRHGAGTVKGSRVIKLDGKKRRYYRIELVNDHSILMIPEETIDDVGLRRPVVDIGMICRIMRKFPEELPSDVRSRRSVVEKSLSKGNSRSIIRIIRDLCWYGKRNDLKESDRRLKQKAELLIASELALKLNRDLKTAQQRLGTIIQEAMQIHLAAIQT